MNEGVGPSCSAREAFLRSLADRARFNGHEIILAEQINTFYPDSPYHETNLIDFEVGIASISDSVVLFSEGVGSLAELGAFTQLSAISERMIVVIQEYFHIKKSFVRDGPIRQLEQLNGKSVQVFDWRSQATGAADLLDEESFSYYLEDIKNGIQDRLDVIPNSQAFDPGNFGHKIMLVCALVEMSGAALAADILAALKAMSIPTNDLELRKMLFCATSVNWLVSERVSHHKYYLSNFDSRACDFAYKPGGVRDTVRWKRDILDKCRATDSQRTRVIQRHISSRGSR